MTKKYTLWGFLIGLFMAVNIMMVGIGGKILYNISLMFVIDNLLNSGLLGGAGEALGWLIGPVFIVLVYTFYGFIVGVITEKIKG